MYCYTWAHAAQYLIQGFFGGPIHHKILWPLAIVTLSLRSNEDNFYTARRIRLDMEYEYRTIPSNVSARDSM
jgi:hypothetical protein